MTIGLGVLLLALARRAWRNRPEPGSEPPMPGWMERVDSMSPLMATGLGAALAAANPKNLILIVAAATGVVRLGADTADVVVATVVFVVVASLSVAAPVVYYLVGGESAKGSLEELRGWLAFHNQAVMSVLFIVFGVILLSNGLAPLTD